MEGVIFSVVVKKLLHVHKRGRRSFENDSSSSDTDDEVLVATRIKGKHGPHNRIEKYAKTVAMYYTLSDFQKHFILSKTAFEVR